MLLSVLPISNQIVPEPTCFMYVILEEIFLEEVLEAEENFLQYQISNYEEWEDSKARADIMSEDWIRSENEFVVGLHIIGMRNSLKKNQFWRAYRDERQTDDKNWLSLRNGI